MKQLFKSLILILIIWSPIHADASEFLNTIMHINFGVCFGFPFGDIFNYERENFSIMERYKRENQTLRPNHYETAFGVTMDVSPFPAIILGKEAHAIKIGVRGGYRFHYLQQKMSVREDASYEINGVKYENNTNDDIDFTDYLMVFHSWMIGPVIRYAPFIDSSNFMGTYTAIGGFTFYVLFGKLENGVLTAFASKRKSNTPTGNYRSKIDGFKMDIGIGGEIAICSINIGINFYYTYIQCEMDEKIYSTIGKTSEIHEVCLELYIGIPIVWNTVPKNL